MNSDDSVEKGFDLKGFYAALSATVRARGLTWKRVAQETLVSASSLTRMAQGRSPDAASLASLSAWAGLNPAEFVRLAARPQSRESLGAISTLLRADPNLAPDAAQALEAMLNAAYDQLKAKSEK